MVSKKSQEKVKKMKHRHFKALTSLLLVVVMLASMLPVIPVTVTAADEGTWTLVTDASTLAVGDKIIIAAKDKAYAISTTQNSNNRGQAAITKSGDTLTTPGSTVAIFTVEEGSTAGTFAFKGADNKYIYCASTSSKNYLRSQATINAAASWKITITASTGAANIVSQISGINRNVLMYNSGSSCFACYSSGQGAVVIYKYVEAPSCDHSNTVAIGTAKAATCTDDGITAGSKCADCNEVLEEQVVIDALGHTDTNPADSKCDTCGANLCAEHVWEIGRAHV